MEGRDTGAGWNPNPECPVGKEAPPMRIKYVEEDKQLLELRKITTLLNQISSQLGNMQSTLLNINRGSRGVHK